MKVEGVRFGILGMARSGISAALKVLELGGVPLISDCKSQEEMRQVCLTYFNNDVWERLLPYSEFGGHSDEILNCDVLIVSPGIPKESRVILQAEERQIEIISEIEFGYRIKNPGSKIIGVTGSNGKSTTVSLVHHILTAAGFRSILAGNIGQPFTSFPIEKPGVDFLVLELSSFQLELIDKFHPDVAVILNISPDHLDRHSTIENYIEAKLRITANQNRDDLVVINGDDHILREKADSFTAARAIFRMSNDSLKGSDCIFESWFQNNQIHLIRKTDYDELTVKLNNLSLLGPHNIQNIMAALLAVYPSLVERFETENLASFLKKAITGFQPLPHRLQLVDVIREINFINDSKATNTESVKYAIASFDTGIHLILGGYHKGEDYSVLEQLIGQRVRKIYLIGEAKEIIYNDLIRFKNIMSCYANLQEAVKSAFTNAVSGETVLLSPACASFDMFRNYEHRGEVFTTIVGEIKENENR